MLFRSTRMQAYYLARAGAEATLQAWKQSGKTNKPVGNSDALYLDKDTNTFVSTLPTNSGGRINVSVNTIGNTTTIVSTGEVNGISQRANVTIVADYLFGHTLNWYSENSGQIQAPTTYVAPSNPPGIHESVILRAKDTGNNLQTIKDPTTATTFEAMVLFFESPLKTFEPIHLIAETIVFDETVTMKNSGSGNDGQLVLYVPEKPSLGISMGIQIDGTTKRYGKIYFKKSVVVNHPTKAEDISGKSFYFLKKSNGSIVEGINLRDAKIRYLGKSVVENLNGDILPGAEPDLIQFDHSSSIWPSATETLKVTWN